jgi:hypothetical protein
MSHTITPPPGCRVEIRGLSPDLAAPSSGPLIASAEPSGDGRWCMAHRDGRHVIVETTVEVLERMIGVAADTSLTERWRKVASLLPASSDRATTLRDCADELLPARPTDTPPEDPAGVYGPPDPDDPDGGAGAGPDATAGAASRSGPDPDSDDPDPGDPEPVHVVASVPVAA